MDLIWDGTSVTVAGPDTRAHVFRHDGGTEMTGLRMAPGHGPVVLGVSADELLDTRVPLEDLWGAATVRRLTDALSGGAVVETLEDAVERRSVPDARDDLMIEHVVALARAGTSIRSIAAEVGLSTRQLQRRSVAAFGYGPKMLVRILRLQRALQLSKSGSSKVDVAVEAGYADQPHLSRDVRELAGVSLGALTK
jgi:AraC-like DNA-binding protein